MYVNFVNFKTSKTTRQNKARKTCCTSSTLVFSKSPKKHLSEKTFFYVKIELLGEVCWLSFAPNGTSGKLKMCFNIKYDQRQIEKDKVLSFLAPLKQNKKTNVSIQRREAERQKNF